MINETTSRDGPCILSLMGADDGKEVITFQELTSSLVPVNEVSICYRPSYRKAHVKKYEHPRTWLCTKLSFIFS